MTAVLLARAPGAARELPPVAEAAPAPRPSRLAATARFTGRWTLRALVAMSIVAFLGLAVGPHVLGYRTVTMLTGSMAPAIEPGDVIVSTPLDVQDVEVGMIITYHIPIDDHRVVTHRVIEVLRADDGTVSVRTQGDANAAPDPWTAVLSGDTAWQVQAVVPELGTVITALREPAVSTALVYGAPALLAGWMLLVIWRPARDDEADDELDTAGAPRA